MRIFTFLTVFLSLFKFAVGQTLSIEETVSYINTTYQSINSKEPDNIVISKNGMVTYLDNQRGWTHTLHVSELQVFGLDNNYFKLGCTQPKSNNINGIQMDNLFKNNCITTDVRFGARQDPTNEIYVNVKDPYVAKKLYNAFQYLLSSIKENGTYTRKDDDPFAPENFNPKSFEIKGTANNSTVHLEKSGGVYNILVTIGTIKKKFVLDSGASDVALSEEFEKELINAGLIKRGNYIASALYRIADGTIVQCRRLIIPELKIGAFTITNVKASVGIGSTPLLLGKSFLDKFKKWTIDNLTETLNLEK